MIKCTIFFLVLFFQLFSLSGQCPDRTFLWNRIVYLRDSSQVTDSDQLRELKSFLDKINNCPNQTDSSHALLLLRIGWLFSKQSDFKSAISYTLRSIDMIRNHVTERSINEVHLIKCYNNLQILYDSTGQFLLKTRAIDSCISLVVRLKSGYNYAVLLVISKIARLFEKGDYYDCINYSNLGESIASKAGNLEQDALYYQTWKINSLIYLNQFREASELLDKAIRDCKKSGNTFYLGSLLGLKAVIAIENGQTAEAIRFVKQSVAYNKSIHNYSGCTGAWINLGYNLFFKKLHQFDRALECYNQALLYASNDESVTVWDNIATVYAEKGDYKKAFLNYQKSFDEIYPGANEVNILSKSGEEILRRVSAEYIVNLELNKAAALVKKYKLQKNPVDLKSALNIYRSADQLMEKIKMVQREFASKLFWRTNSRRLYENAIESCLLSGNIGEAFYFFEKSRAVLLNDRLLEQQTGDDMIEEMSVVKKNILNLERQMISLDPSTTEYGKIQREIFLKKEQLSYQDQLLKEKNPWYHQSMLDTSFTSLEEIQRRILGNKEADAILEFFNGDSSVYLLTITAGKSGITRINKKEFEKKVDQYTIYLSDPALENQDFNGFIKTGQQLYQLIFKDSPLPEGRIIVSQDGKYFPLEALISNQNSSAPEYLLNKHILSYTYSVRFLLNDFLKNRPSSAGNFLGVAPVNYPAAFQLAALSQSDASLRKIVSNFTKTRAFTGENASRKNFMQQFQAYKIIQLYTHASDSSSRGEPVIYFADSALFLSELIPENKTATQLIVLSACETGNGKFFKGEGVFSFNREFAAMGIPSSVINLWSVDDESTYKLTELFYKYVSKGLALDLAMQKAKLDFIAGSSKEKKLPYYWAAAILAGKTDPVETSRGISWGRIALITGILLILLKLVHSKWKPKKTSTA